MGLLDFLKKIPTVNEIKGGFGEWLTKTYSKAFIGALVLHDVLIDGTDGYTSQIDLILIGNKGIIVVEVKSFDNAKIYGNVEKNKWNYYMGGNKYEIYSPIKQNEKHIEYLKKFLMDFGEIPMFSIVTMICNDFKLTGELNKDGNLTSAVCSSLPSMERAIAKIVKDKPIVLDDIKKKAIFDYISENQHKGRDARIEHKEKVIVYKDQMDEMKKQKICPYCKIELILRSGKNGNFYGCKNFPKCRYTLKFDE